MQTIISVNLQRILFLSCDVNKLKESGQIKVEEKNESATAHTSDSLMCSWILMAVKCVMWLGGLGLFIHFGFGSGSPLYCFHMPITLYGFMLRKDIYIIRVHTQLL